MEEPFGFLQNLGVIIVEPCFLFACQQARVDQILAVGHHGDMLEPEERLVSKTVLGLDLLDHDYVFDADTVGVFYVVSRLIGDDVARGEGDLGILRAGSNTYGAFVNVEIGANTVAGAVPIVKAVFLHHALVIDKAYVRLVVIQLTQRC